MKSIDFKFQFNEKLKINENEQFAAAIIAAAAQLDQPSNAGMILEILSSLDKSVVYKSEVVRLSFENSKIKFEYQANALKINGNYLVVKFVEKNKDFFIAIYDNNRCYKFGCYLANVKKANQNVYDLIMKLINNKP